MYELKIYREVLCHGNEEWSKIWRGIDLSVQNWREEFDEVWPEHLKISKICTLRGFFSTKYIMFELKTVQGSFVSWQWKMIPNLKRNSIVSSKLIWRIWQILNRALKNLKNLQFSRLLLTKVCNVWAKNSMEELCLMALKTDAKFEGKLTCAF